MPATPCLRHPAHVWMAYCPDCTAWHLGRVTARRAHTGNAPSTAAVPSR